MPDQPTTSTAFDAFFDGIRLQLTVRRHALGLNQRQLAARMHCAQSFLGQLETGCGNRHPTLITLTRWADALDLDLDVQLTERPAPPPEPREAP